MQGKYPTLLSIFLVAVLFGCQDGSETIDPLLSGEPVGIALTSVPELPVARIHGFGTLPDGYFLLDGPNARVLVIGRDGKVSRAIGRHGGAPGEFRGAHRATASADGRIAVLDPPFVTVFSRSGEVTARFMTKPTLGSLEWGCKDSVLVFAGHGDVSPSSNSPAFDYFSTDGTLVGASPKWPRWSRFMNNSIAALAISERDCVVTAVEALGRNYAQLDLKVKQGEIELHEVPWTENPAQVMTSAVDAGSEPMAAGRLVSRNVGIWRVAGDTVLVRQDSTLSDQSISFRYRLVANGGSSSSGLTELQIWEADADSISFTKLRDDGTIEIGRASILWLLDPLRKALARGAM